MADVSFFSRLSLLGWLSLLLGAGAVYVRLATIPSSLSRNAERATDGVRADNLLRYQA